MSHPRVIQQFNGSAWYLTPEAMREVQAFVETMDMGRVADLQKEAQMATANRDAIDPKKKEKEYEYEEYYSMEGGRATVPITGKIFGRANMMTALSGGVSTQMLTGAMKELEEREDVQSVLMLFDSPGGEGTGLTNLAKTIRDMETDTVSFAQGGMYSAAYYIGSAADEVYVSPNGGVGSIGVYAAVTSYAEKMDDEGIDVAVVRSVPGKALGHPSEPIDEETVQDVQERVDSLHQEFVRQVAQNRNLSIDYVNETMADGSVKQGRQAEDTDFADGVATLSEVLENMDYSEEGDEFDSRGDYAFSVLSDRYEELRDRHEAAMSTVTDLRERVTELEEELGQKEEAALEVRAEQVATEAVEQDKKFAPAKKEWLQERLMEDFEGTKEMIDNVPSGAAGPSESLETADTSVADTDQEKVDKLKSQGIRPVYPDEEGKAETYRDLGWKDGEDFFLVSEIDKYNA